MNIAFYTYFKCIPTIGGTERTTSLVADTLQTYYDHKPFSIYSIDADGIRSNTFIEEFKYTNSSKKILEFVEFIKRHEISVIINAVDFRFGIELHKILTSYKLNCKQIFALHFTPGRYEQAKISAGELYRRIKQSHRFSDIFKLVFYPLYYPITNTTYRKLYRSISKKADGIVLLSDQYKDDWIKYARLHHNPEIAKKIISIPNASPFSSAKINLNKKEKSILIVSRLDERQKKISKAIKLWEIVTRQNSIIDWRLDIVGTGPDYEFYNSMIKELNLPNVKLHGYQDPRPFYEKAAISIMTSDFEGFPMTLVESLQYGVVPIVFNTFSAITDIINNETNGYIIQKDDNSDFIEKLKLLMMNKDILSALANNALYSAKRFLPIAICEKWQSIITKLSNTK